MTPTVRVLSTGPLESAMAGRPCSACINGHSPPLPEVLAPFVAQDRRARLVQLAGPLRLALEHTALTQGRLSAVGGLRHGRKRKQPKGVVNNEKNTALSGGPVMNSHTPLQVAVFFLPDPPLPACVSHFCLRCFHYHEVYVFGARAITARSVWICSVFCVATCCCTGATAR